MLFQFQISVYLGNMGKIPLFGSLILSQQLSPTPRSLHRLTTGSKPSPIIGDTTKHSLKLPMYHNGFRYYDVDGLTRQWSILWDDHLVAEAMESKSSQHHLISNNLELHVLLSANCSQMQNMEAYQQVYPYKLNFPHLIYRFQSPSLQVILEQHLVQDSLKLLYDLQEGSMSLEILSLIVLS